MVKTKRGGTFSIHELAPGRYRTNYSTNTAFDVDLPDRDIVAGSPLVVSIPARGVITVHEDQDGAGGNPPPAPANLRIIHQ
jgi:hypothetical protein